MTIRYNRLIKKADENEQLFEHLGMLMGCKFKRDWIGRIYTVLNPSLNEENKYDSNTQIFEYGENGLSDMAGVEAWVMRRLNIAQQFIQAQNLFDLLTFRIKKIDNYNNFLFIFEVIPMQDLFKYTKRFLILLAVLVVLGVAALIIL